LRRNLNRKRLLFFRLRTVSFEFAAFDFHDSESFANWLPSILIEMQSSAWHQCALSKCLPLREMERFCQEDPVIIAVCHNRREFFFRSQRGTNRCPDKSANCRICWISA
jgi:hypothetical protein